MVKEPARIDSGVYAHEFYGILNKSGEFWTPLAFDTERAARKHIEDFVLTNPGKFKSIEQTHRIVPVRITLEEIRP